MSTRDRRFTSNTIITPNTTRSVGPEWDPRIVVLLRPDGRLQLGWQPERAVVLTPPPGVDARDMQSLLRMMDGHTSVATMMWTATQRGISSDVMTALVSELTTAGFLRPSRQETVRAGSIRIHGQGPLSDTIRQALRHGNSPVQRSHGYRGSHLVADWQNALVVLTDDVVTDPRLVADLVRAGIPHLAVHVRDGSGVVGPLVLPGHSSCLRCADITRADHDPDWLHLASQLLGSAGYADPAMIHATTALALSEISSAMRASEATPPASLFTTLEIDLVPYRITMRHWPRQTSCSCFYLAPVTGAGRVRQT
ncbi:hypothetical protein [Rhodococcus sp. ARC_M6]|uniref:hypothetical protein n=1 Tax=Rhodococcus sp. ARC_M6 TaxID=2928852 RepID=UPI001FB3DF55|nr:hypothetical protein [Rhodococcus sp. ARC_M6]MCJ0903507.1 hypothetical protein [Rhodococcus sp. ARC_M6]